MAADGEGLDAEPQAGPPGRPDGGTAGGSGSPSKAPATLPCVVRLASGHLLTVRHAQPEDAAAMRALYHGLSSEDRYRRFFSSYDPSAQKIERWIDARDQGAVRLIAVLDDGRVVADTGYYLMDANGHDAEFDITVADEARGWLAAFLLDQLVTTARGRGVVNLHATILVGNAPMLALVRGRGCVTLPHDDRSAVRVVIGARDPVPEWPASDESRRRVLVEGPGLAWETDAQLRARGVAVAVCPGPGGRHIDCPVLRGQPCPLAAGADAIVVTLPLTDPDATRILAAHADLHPNAVLCVEPRTRGAGRSMRRAGLPSDVVVLEGDAEDGQTLLRQLGIDPSVLPTRSAAAERTPPSGQP